MKVIFQKRLESGSYHVQIIVSDFSSIEIENMKRFGPPTISIAPMNIYITGQGRVSALPVHSLNYDFQFSSQTEAVDFVKNMTDRIKIAANVLKAKKDDFSGQSEVLF